CDNGTEFKNADLNQFCRLKGIKREFSVHRTSQQNGIAERKNRTLIEAARTLLADSLLPIPFWAEAVNTACYVDEGFLIGYSVCSKAFRVFNSRTRIAQETLHRINLTLMQVSMTQQKQGRKELKHICFFLCYLMVLQILRTTTKMLLLNGKEHDDDIQKSMSPDIHSSSCGDQTRKQEFEDCINNSSNEVNAAGSSVFAAGLNFTNSTNDFGAAGPSNTAMPNLKDDVAEILRKFGLSEGKSASTPIDVEKPLLKDLDGISLYLSAKIIKIHASMDGRISPISSLVFHPYSPLQIPDIKRIKVDPMLYDNKVLARCISI
nr:ribonuclease H-like domain-containing protein [Tanacetum cinerariifolium]